MELEMCDLSVGSQHGQLRRALGQLDHSSIFMLVPDWIIVLYPRSIQFYHILGLMMKTQGCERDGFCGGTVS